MSRRMTFALPHYYDHPIGGYKVHLQYANAFAERGDRVTVLHPLTCGSTATLRETAVYLRGRARKATGQPIIPWFASHPEVRHKLVRSLDGSHLPEADVTILTGWQSSESTRRPSPQSGVLMQIVYDYEFWMGNPDHRERIEAALVRPDVAHVSTSTAVTSMLTDLGVDPFATITAGLQPGDFGVDSPIDGRSPVIGFPLRDEPAKDMPTLFTSIALVRRAFPNVRVQCFGGSAGLAVPAGVESLGRLTNSELRAFYNGCSIFMLSSRYEGWGLPALEAMACGATVVSTRNGGTEDFVHDGHTGVLVPTGDAASLAGAVLDLLGDSSRRSEIGRRGAAVASRETVVRSADMLDDVIVRLCS